VLPRREGNPYFPLPPDYGELTQEGSREARLALCRGWYDPENPTQLISDPEAFYWAFKFWKQYYRKRSKWNRVKYTDKDPPIHDELVRLFTQNTLLVATCFRGAGKTFLFGEEIPEFIITNRPGTAVQYTSSTQPLTDKQIRAVKMDLMHNECIREDYGKLKPAVNSGLKWAAEGIELENQSSFYAISVDSRQRGTTQISLRSILQILDDWETDEGVKNPKTLEEYENYLFDVFFPCADLRAWRIWTNTLLDERAWAMRALTRSDKRFSTWTASRKFQEVWYVENGELKSWWPDRFKVSTLKVLQSDGDDLGEESRGMLAIGKLAFDQEYLNNPAARGGSAFGVEKMVHGFRWEGDAARPIVVELATGKSTPLHELVAGGRKAVGVDVSLGLKQSSDLSAIIPGVLTVDDVLVVTGGWLGREKPVDVIRRAMQTVEFWQSDILGVERTIFEQILVDMLDTEIRMRRRMGLHAPELFVAVKAGSKITKPQRLLSIQYRFTARPVKILIPAETRIQHEMFQVPETLWGQLQRVQSDGNSSTHDDGPDALVTMHEALFGVLQPRKLVQEESILARAERLRQAGVNVALPNAIPLEELHLAEIGVSQDFFSDPDSGVDWV